MLDSQHKSEAEAVVAYCLQSHNRICLILNLATQLDFHKFPPGTAYAVSSAMLACFLIVYALQLAIRPKLPLTFIIPTVNATKPPHNP